MQEAFGYTTAFLLTDLNKELLALLELLSDARCFFRKDSDVNSDKTNLKIHVTTVEVFWRPLKVEGRATPRLVCAY